MSTATLLSKRPVGAQEAPRPSEGISPAVIYPGIATLGRALSDFERSAEELELYRGRVARAEADIDMADSSPTLSEEAVAAKIIQANAQKGVYQSRLSAREEGQAKLLGSLKSAVNSGHNEHETVIMEVLNKRVPIIRERIVEAGQLAENADFVNEVVEYAKPISSIRSMSISSGALFVCDSAEQCVGMARRILASFEKLLVEKRRQI